MNPQIVVEYVANTAKLQAANAKLGGNMSKAGAASRRAFLPAVAVLGGLTLAAGKAVNAASDLNESQNKSQVVFGKSAKTVDDWAKTTAKGYGISRNAALGAASTFGDMFSQLGLGQEAAAKTSTRMVELAGDLGSFHNVDPSDVLQRMQAAFRGEYDSIQALIPGINAARVEQVALATTHKKSAKQLTALEKAQATQKILLDDSKNAANDAAETADSYAGRQRRLKAAQEDLAASMGQALLPAMETLTGLLQKVAALAAEHPAIFKALVAVLGVLAGVIIANNVALAVTAIITGPLTLSILAIVAAVVALVAIAIILWKNWDKVTAALQAGWDRIKGAALGVLNWAKRNWPLIVAILTGPLGIAVLLITRNWQRIKDAFRSAWDFVRGIVAKIAAFFGKIPDAAKAAADRVKSVLGGMVDFLRGLISKVGGIASSIASAIKAPINAVIGAINAVQIPAFTLPSVDTHLPGIGKVGGGTVGPWDLFPDIPKLALGGIVTRPTVAMVGEAGPEAVVPLDAFPSRPLVNVETLVVEEPMDLQRIAASLSAAVAVRL